MSSNLAQKRFGAYLYEVRLKAQTLLRLSFILNTILTNFSNQKH